MNILTFDIEDWFHILDNPQTKTLEHWNQYPSRFEVVTDRLLTILGERGLSATFFCLGWMAEKHPAVIRRIKEAGHEVGSHSYAHQLAYEMKPAEFRADLIRSIRILEDSTGGRIKYYRAPGFSLMQSNSWVFDELIEQGIEVDCSIFPASRAHGGFQNFGTAQPAIVKTDSGSIMELPITTTILAGASLVFSGGGYFRLLPYPIIRYLSRRSKYVMTYFHPRDFDPDQPMLPGLGIIRRFKSYYGLRFANDKLLKYLDDFEFIDVGEAVRQVDWKSVPTIRVS